MHPEGGEYGGIKGGCDDNGFVNVLQSGMILKIAMI